MRARLRVLAVVLLVCVACRTGTPPQHFRPRLAAGSVPPYAPSQPYGNLPGTFSADAGGAATFDLPIDVPPGTAGVQPGLALNYNSHRQDGYAGMGWQLSGLSAIGRCGANYELDGFKGGVAFDARDRFCIDGRRLVPVSGSNGADGTVYHTTQETQTSVISHGICGSGPCSFTAYNKEGVRLSFGGNTDSRILAQGRSDGSVRAWAIDRQTDLNGNYSSVTYSNDVAAGEYTPLHIDYTANDAAKLPAQRRVSFEYQTRPDVVRRYLGGSLVQITKRLASITTSVSGAGSEETVQTYRLAYDTSPFTLRSRLTSVTLCDAAGVCLPPVSFTWQTEPGQFRTASTQLPGPLYALVGTRVFPIGILQDLDGDGIADYSVATEFLSAKTTVDLAVWLGRPDGTFVPAGFSLPGPLYRATSTSVVLSGVLQDLNGDAILDYSPATLNASTGQSDLSVYLGTRHGFTRASFDLPDGVYWLVNGQTMQTGIVADMNGDGIPDYSRATRLTSNNQSFLSIWKGTGSGFTDTGKTLPGPLFNVGSSNSTRAGVLQDIDGDGIADYSPATVNANSGTSDLAVWTGRTPDFTFAKSFDLPGQLLWMVNGQSLDSGLLVDLNGDGIPDYSRATELLSTGEKLLDVQLGTGEGFVASGFKLPGPLFLISGSRADIDGVVTQMNGDGTSRYSRATVFGDNTKDLSVWLGSGVGFRQASFSMPEALYEIFGSQVYPKGIYEDINGDGMTDYASTRCTMTAPGVFADCSLGVRLATGPFSDLLSTITNSFGGTTSLAYAPISDPAIYARGDTPAYPVRDAQSSMYALSRYVNSDARGASYAFNYRYSGARFDVLGRDWLGFTTVTMTEEAGGRQSETTYSMTYPYYGLAAATAIRGPDGKLLETTAIGYTDFAPPDHQSLGIHQPLETSFTDTINQDGAPAFSYGCDYDYDSYGNRTFEAERGDEATHVLPVYHCVRYSNDPAPGVNRLGYRQQAKSTRTAEACRAFLAIDGGGDVHWDPATDLRWSTISYDEAMNVIGQASWDDSHSSFVAASYTVDAYGNTLSIAAPWGATTRYTYDATYQAFLESVTYPTLTRSDGSNYSMSTSYVIEPYFGTLVQTVDANGNVNQQELDGFGRPVAEWGPDPDGNLVQLVSTLWKRDAVNYLETRVRPGWTSSSDPATWYWQRELHDGLLRPYRQESNGLRQGQPATIVTEDFFDAQGRVHQRAAAHFEGDAVPLSTVDYDVLNRPVLSTDPSNTKERVEYYDGGLKVLQTSAYGTPEATTAIKYLDVASRTIESIAPNGQSESFRYDPLGQLISTSAAPLSRPSSLTFDSLGRVRTLTRADTGTTSWTFDASTRIRNITDASGNTIDFDEYDTLRRPHKRTAKYGGSTAVWSYTFDETAYRNGLSHLTTAVVEAPVLGTATYHYAWDAYENALAGDVTMQGTTYHYAKLRDPLARPVEEIDPDGGVVSMRYGADGNLAGIDVTEPGEQAARPYATLTNYTALGELQDLALDQNGVQVARRFYAENVAFGKLKSIAATSTRQSNQTLLSLTYVWNHLNEVTQIADHRDAAQSQTFGYQDQALNKGMGFLTSASGGYGSKSYQYEQLGNVTDQNGTTYTYQPGSDHIAGSSAGVTWHFAPNGYLQTRTEEGRQQEYSFDADGNLVGIEEAAVPLLQAAYDHTGRKVLEKTSGGPPAGTTVQRITEGYEVSDLGDGKIQHTRYIAGPFGPLVSITGSGTGVDGAAGLSQRNRVRALMSGRMPALFTALALLPQMLRAAGTAAFCAFAFFPLFIRRRTRYARSNPRFSAIAPIVIACMLLTALPAFGELTPGGNGAGVPTAGRLFFIQNLVGSTAAVTGEDGAETARVGYEPFGAVDPQSSQGTDNFRPKFSGKQFDPRLGLYDFGARSFDPRLGRFIAPDPMNQFVSPYLYAGSDPVGRIDPDGQFAFVAAVVVGAVVGAYFGGASVNGDFNPFNWNWQSGTTWAGIFGGAALGAVGAAAGGLVVQAGVAVGSMGGTAAQLAGVAIGIGGEALIGAGENAAFAALGGASGKEIVQAAVEGAFFGAVFGGGAMAVDQVASRAARSGNADGGEASVMRGADNQSDAPCSCGCGSFVAGTPVTLADGTQRSIESIRGGDRVVGRNPENGEWLAAGVTELVRHDVRDLVRITLATGEQLDVTPEHPFYVDRSGWVAARDLGPGMALATESGTPVLVASAEQRREPAPIPVFNFRVAGAESYFAGDARVLVHNPRLNASTKKVPYCSAAIDSSGVVTETWNGPQLKKRFPNTAEYQAIVKDIEFKAGLANKMINQKKIKPYTRVSNPVGTASQMWMIDRFAIRFGLNHPVPTSIREGMQELRPRKWGWLQDVDEAISRIQGGLTIREGVPENQFPINSFVNYASGAAAGALSRRGPVQRITKYRVKITP